MPEKDTQKYRQRLWKIFLSTLYLSAFTFGGGYVIVTLMKKKFDRSQRSHRGGVQAGRDPGDTGGDPRNDPAPFCHHFRDLHLLQCIPQ